ncbi:MAG: hypothetical protein M3Q76_04890, partial [Acidobacteriota bacterium]|nr:hypothetical protein [Acidobacteriota bacterium]
VPDTAYKLFALIVLGALALWIVFRRDARKDKGGFARDAAWLAVAFTVLLSPHYTWYFVWLVPFLCFVRGLSLVPLFCLTVASFVLYGTWLGDKPDDMLRLNSILYLPAAALGFIVWLARRVRRQETI